MTWALTSSIDQSLLIQLCELLYFLAEPPGYSESESGCRPSSLHYRATYGSCEQATLYCFSEQPDNCTHLQAHGAPIQRGGEGLSLECRHVLDLLSEPHHDLLSFSAKSSVRGDQGVWGWREGEIVNEHAIIIL